MRLVTILDCTMSQVPARTGDQRPTRQLRQHQAHSQLDRQHIRHVQPLSNAISLPGWPHHIFITPALLFIIAALLDTLFCFSSSLSCWLYCFVLYDRCLAGHIAIKRFFTHSPTLEQVVPAFHFRGP